jgi:hypothetical protein
MGDRGNIVFHGSDVEGIVFYTHWKGSELPQIVAKALGRKERWDDPPYLLRIIFSELVGEEDLKEETGYGISNTLCDNENPVVHINVDEQLVSFSGCSIDDSELVEPKGQKLTFNGFLEAAKLAKEK